MRGDHKTLAPSRKNVRRTILDVLGASSLALFFFVFEISLSSAVGRRHWQASRHHDRSSLDGEASASANPMDPYPDLDQLINRDRCPLYPLLVFCRVMLRWSASSLSAARTFASMAIFTACFSASLDVELVARGRGNRVAPGARSLKQVKAKATSAPRPCSGPDRYACVRVQSL